MPSLRKLVALDFYFLKNWVQEAPHHNEALQFFISHSFTPVILPIVDAAISDIDGDSETKAFGRRIREEVQDSIIETLSYGRDLDREINIKNGTEVADRNVLSGAIPSDTIMLAEAAFFDVFALLTPRKCFTEAGQESLKVALVDCGFPQSIVIFSPLEIHEYLTKVRAARQ